MNVLVRLATMVTMVSMITGCAREHYLKLKDVNINVREKMVGSVLHLEINGMIFASALNVKHVDTKIRGEYANVRVYPATALAGGSGAIEYDFVIPTGVNYVSFGDESDVIWRRKPKVSTSSGRDAGHDNS
jgi:hypothetical protein